MSRTKPSATPPADSLQRNPLFKNNILVLARLSDAQFYELLKLLQQSNSTDIKQ